MKRPLNTPRRGSGCSVGEMETQILPPSLFAKMSWSLLLSRSSLKLSAPAVASIQIAQFSKYISKARTKRLPLTTKRVGKGYNKGNGARKEGVLDSKGKFHRIPEMCTELIVPDLTGFTLKPYIAVGAKRNVREAIVNL